MINSPATSRIFIPFSHADHDSSLFGIFKDFDENQIMRKFPENFNFEISFRTFKL